MKKRTTDLPARPFWLAVRNNVIPPDMAAFETKREATHYIDHRVEGWFDPINDPHGWRLFRAPVEAEYR